MAATALARVPVLMYHEIAEPPETYDRLAVAPSAFARQLAYLRDEGLRTITAGALVAALAAGETLPPRVAVLTFDDGYENFYSRALPLLDEYGCTATLFVTSGWVADPAQQPGVPARMLSWQQVAEAAAAGVEIAAHSRRHPQLDQIPQRLLREELYESKARLEDKLGFDVPGMAYPYGYSDARVRQVTRDTGYGYACSVNNATLTAASDPFALPRLTIRQATTMATFGKILAGHRTTQVLQDRALTSGYSVVRRTRKTVNAVSRGLRADSV
jgi:peptidoglycan/xylan/chitin deacetylase (PgdA/CDA1 family)